MNSDGQSKDFLQLVDDEAEFVDVQRKFFKFVAFDDDAKSFEHDDDAIEEGEETHAIHGQVVVASNEIYPNRPVIRHIDNSDINNV